MEESILLPPDWFAERATPTDMYVHKIKKLLYQHKTAFQDVKIVESSSLGKALVLDGKWQSSSSDEFFYHELLVHPALLWHGEPRSVLILGGGEGATAREVLRWRSIQAVTMVDIDREVVEACQRYLPEMHQGAFGDNRLKVVFADAFSYLSEALGQWDVVVFDLSDPIENGPSFKLFTKEFIDLVFHALSDDGYFVMQAGPIGPIESDLHRHSRVLSTVRSIFPHTTSYVSVIPTYPAPWSFVLGSKVTIPLELEVNVTDRLLAEKVEGSLRAFDGIVLKGLSCLPLMIRRAAELNLSPYSLEEPPKFF
jgi:spermidine synthase